MPSSRIPSPARSQGVISTPRKHLRRTRSVGSPARTNLRLSSIIESYKVSPAPNRKSVLNDDTDIDMPRRGSWWKKIDDNSRDVLELLESKELVEVNNVAEEFDVEVLSQEKKNYTLDLPESSDGESISSIVIPQRVLFTQKDNQPQIKFGQIKNNRETLQKLNKSYVDHDKEVNIGRKTLFSQPSKPRTKPVFPAALLDISANKTANKTKEIPSEEVKGQVRSLFGSRPGTKRKNMFADFIVSESEDDIPEIQPIVFGEPKRRASLISRHLHASSIDLEMEDWRQLPSSTMFEHQFEEAISPVKRLKLSNLLETKDSEINNSTNKTKANKSLSSKNKSKNVSNIENEDDNVNEIIITPRNATINKSRVTRSMSKSLTENSAIVLNTSKSLNKTRNKTQNNLNRSNESKTGKTNRNISQRENNKDQEKQNILADQPDPGEDFILKYNDDTEVLENRTLKNDKNLKDKSISNLNVDMDEDKNNFVESSRKKSKENVVEQQKSTNKICQNQAELLMNEQNNMESNEILNHSKTQNNSQDLENVVALNKDSNYVKKHNRSIEKNTDKNKSKSISNSVEKCNVHSSDKNVQKEKSSQVQNVDKDVQQNEQLDTSNHNLNEENQKDQEIESETEQNKSDNNSDQHSEVEEETNESTQLEENDGSEIDEENEEVESDVEEENECLTTNVSKEKADNEEQDVMHDNNTDERDKELMLDDQLDNIDNIVHVPSPNVSHDTTGRHKKEIKSPELMLLGKTKPIDSFTEHGRDTNIRKTKSITFHNKIETVKDFTGFSDGTGNSSAEGSGWDSHRTTRKTLRQTFGKDFTPRKSLRALVMEKTAKLQANFSSVIYKGDLPQANSTEYIKVQDELNSLEPEVMQVEHDIEIVHVDERLKTIRTGENVQIGVSDVTDRLEEKDKTEQLEERDEVDQFENELRDVTKPFDDIETMKQDESLDKNDRAQTENDEIEREEMEEPEEEEEMEESEEEEIEKSEEEEIEKSEERRELEESEEAEEMEKSEEREEMEEFEEEKEMEKSEEREEMEESEEEEMEKSDEREEMEESEEEEMGKSDEREEMEESEERREIEESESEERNETDQYEKRDELELSENKEKDETDQFEDRHEMDESTNEERDDTEQFEERDETVPDDESNVEESEQEVSKRTRQTSLESYLQKIKQDNAEKRRKMQEELRNSLKNPKTDTFNLFKVPQKPVRRTMKVQKPKAKQIKSVLPLDMLPSEFIEDMKYKPPKRFQPNNASWITKRLYKFLENKLEPKYDYKARIRAEKLVQCIYNFTKEVRRHDTVRSDGIEELKREMARLDIVKTHFDFYEFCHEFFPREIRIKIVPDIVNNISLPRHGVFSDILR